MADEDTHTDDDWTIIRGEVSWYGDGDAEWVWEVVE